MSRCTQLGLKMCKKNTLTLNAQVLSPFDCQKLFHSYAALLVKVWKFSYLSAIECIYASDISNRY